MVEGIETSEFNPGDLVRHGQDIGHFVQKTNNIVEVEFMEVPGKSGMFIRNVPEPEIQSVLLEPRTRIWFYEDDCWRIARIDQPPALGDLKYLVDLSNDGYRNLLPSEIFVCSKTESRDPTRFLINRATESRFLNSHRSRFVNEMLRQVSAVDGLTGIGSSGVQLYQHQVSAARKVLLDPIKRYLLADEVGLGKTIEAGMVARQLMIDNPRARVLIMVPDSLVPQWRTEMESKFRLQGLNMGYVEIQAHSWLREEGASDKIFDLVIVDEAHRLTLETSNATDYQVLDSICSATPHLLLLSATPVRSNESAFLKLLHLLDPETYRLDEVELFKQRIEKRDGVANALSLLVSGSADFLLEEALEILRISFPNDGHLTKLLKELEASLQEGVEEVILRNSLVCSQYVSETYRLHRRMIRTRRDERLQKLFPVRERDRSPDWKIVDDDARRPPIVEVLDRFRSELVAAEDLPQAEMLRLVGSRLCSATPAVEGLMKGLNERDHSDLLPWEVPLVTVLSEHALGVELGGWLSDVLFVGGLDSRVEAAVERAWSFVDKKKIAVFTSYGSVGRAVARRMIERFGDHRVAALLNGMSKEELQREAIRAKDDPLCTLLVCDSVAEEGWNLQFSDEVLHMDIPWAANQLEQRLGRFDRFTSVGSSLNPILSSVFIDPGESSKISDPWIQLMDVAFQLFQTSSASLQYVLPEREEAALVSILENGFLGLTEDMDAEAQLVLKLRKEIQGQDLLDSFDSSDADEIFFHVLKSNDGKIARIQDVFDFWVCKALNFSRTKGNPPWSIGVSSRNPPMLPESVVRGLGIETLQSRYVFDREMAKNNGLIRPGEPIIDRVLEFTLKDDRGIAFAGYREVSQLPQDTPPQAFYYFDVLAQPSLKHLDHLSKAERLIIHRMSLQYFPMLIEGNWVKVGGGRLPKNFVTRLESDRTEDLAEQPELFIDLTSGMDWEATCRSAEDEAIQQAFGENLLDDRIRKALASLADEELHFSARQTARSQTFEGNSEISFEVAKFKLTREAIENVTISIDNCGVVFMGPPR